MRIVQDQPIHVGAKHGVPIEINRITKDWYNLHLVRKSVLGDGETGHGRQQRHKVGRGQWPKCLHVTSLWSGGIYNQSYKAYKA